MGSIHAAMQQCSNADFLGAVGILHATTHETSHLAKERPSQGDATPNHTAGSFFIEMKTSSQWEKKGVRFFLLKETFTICFELQSLSALLDIHMMIITSFERDCLARGVSPSPGSTNSSEAGSNISHQYVGGHHRTTAGERCNLQLRFQSDCKTV
jgi:hypothetical protein